MWTRWERVKNKNILRMSYMDAPLMNSGKRAFSLYVVCRKDIDFVNGTLHVLLPFSEPLPYNGRNAGNGNVHIQGSALVSAEVLEYEFNSE